MKVAILTMTFNPINRMNAIINAHEQSWPDKTLYLMEQRPRPDPIIAHPFDFEIKEFKVKGVWPALWALKLSAFLNSCTEEIFVWMDEDDRYERDFIAKAVTPILEGKGDICVNMENIDVMRGRFLRQGCSVGSGTLAAKTDIYKSLYFKFLTDYGGLVLKKKRDFHPLDGPLWHNVLANHPRLCYHEGTRYYFYHSGSQCKAHRKDENRID